MLCVLETKGLCIHVLLLCVQVAGVLLVLFWLQLVLLIVVEIVLLWLLSKML